jgi:hypothetical protein
MMPPMMPQPMPQQVMPPMMMPQQIMPPAAPIVAPPQHVAAVPGQMPAAPLMPLNSPVSSSPAPEPLPRTTEGTANPEAGRKVVNLPLDRRRAPAPARNPEAEQQLDFMTELPDIL